jgi:hypothetical protein
MLRQKLFCTALIASMVAGSIAASAAGYDPEDEARAFAGPVDAQLTNAKQRLMPPEFNWSADEPIIREQIVAGMATLRPGEAPGQDVLTSMVTWVSNVLDIPAIYDLPNVERTPRIKLAAVLHNSHFVSQETILSNYDGAKQSIYLPDDWRGNTPAGTSILIHEMAHHLQQVARAHYDCSQWEEKLAYVAQQQWLAPYGRNLEKDFGIDPLTYLLTTECYIP